MKSTLKVFLIYGLVTLFGSCQNAAPDQKTEKIVSADSIPLEKPGHDPSQRTAEEAKTIIDDLYKRASSGEDFAKLAIQYSEDPGSAKTGGEYDGVQKGVMVPEFEKVVFSLNLNEVSKPFLTEYGYHIATVIAIRNEERDVRHILIQFQH